ncbi:MAG: hypothetical protein V4480_03775 [Patescibacteria group bacterium]
MQKKELVIPLVAIVLIVLIAVLLVWHSAGPENGSPVLGTSATTSIALPATSTITQSTTIVSTSETYYPYGSVTLSLNEPAGFKDGFSIRPTAILEDSRCPEDVECIQAGTVRISLKASSPKDSSTVQVSLGKSITVGSETITFESVVPARAEGVRIADSAYRFTLRVEKTAVSSGPPPVVTTKPCYIGGCSSELCTDAPGGVSSCIYRSEYACYRGATCARQSDGKCGWTPTPELKSCLANPPALQ